MNGTYVFIGIGILVACVIAFVMIMSIRDARRQAQARINQITGNTGAGNTQNQTPQPQPQPKPKKSSGNLWEPFKGILYIVFGGLFLLFPGPELVHIWFDIDVYEPRPNGLFAKIIYTVLLFWSLISVVAGRWMVIKIVGSLVPLGGATTRTNYQRALKEMQDGILKILPFVMLCILLGLGLWGWHSIDAYAEFLQGKIPQEEIDQYYGRYLFWGIGYISVIGFWGILVRMLDWPIEWLKGK